MRFVEHGEKFTATKENQRGDVVDHIEKTDRRRDEHETQQEQGPRFVHVAQQAIERDAKTGENNLPDEIAEDRQSKHGLVRENVRSSRGGVAADDELVRNVKHAKRRSDYHREVDEPSDACGFDSWMHGLPRCVTARIGRAFVGQALRLPSYD